MRAMMAKAALTDGWQPRTLRFTGALPAVSIFTMAQLLSAQATIAPLQHALLSTIAGHRVGQRPNRVEPRAVKRRPKPHALLTVPRKLAKERLMKGRAA